jgi:hypothetical protein
MKNLKDMKKILTALVILVLTTICISSCSNDDNESNKNIVGVWVDNSEKDGYKFLDNGSFYEYSATNSNKNWGDSGTYSLRKGKLILYWDGEVNDVDTFNIIFNNENSFTLSTHNYFNTYYRFYTDLI